MKGSARVKIIRNEGEGRRGQFEQICSMYCLFLSTIHSNHVRIISNYRSNVKMEFCVIGSREEHVFDKGSC